MDKLSAAQVKSWKGRIIDVRGYDEFATERLAGAECVPLDRILSAASQWDPQERLLLMCKSGVRSGKAADQLAQVGFANLVTLEGGIEACKAARLLFSTFIWSKADRRLLLDLATPSSFSF